MGSFLLGLFLLCASTLMYEIVLTRLLSTISWYYLAFVSVSMAMFGMTAGALMVHLRAEYFGESVIRKRLSQATLAAAISLPLALLTMLAIPVDIALALQTLYSFLLFSMVIAVPFFFAGVAVCLSLTRVPFPMGRIYFVDLAGAAAGCLASVLLLKVIDAPSALFAVSGILFASSAAYASFAGETRSRRTGLKWAAGLLVIAGLNALTPYGFQPIWGKGEIDRRADILAEVWNPISKVRARTPRLTKPLMWGPSPKTPDFRVEQINLNIDNDAGTAITRFDGNLSSDSLDFLRYDVTSLGAELRAGGSAAIIGVGGGRDVLNAARNGFTRIVGIEVNSAITSLISDRFAAFAGLQKIPGFELHNDEGRSYLTRSGGRFDLIQASLVDTWAATSAGAMALTENTLYTVEGWRVFYEHLKPGGIITFSRWYSDELRSETYRLFAVAHAMLLSEGVANPSEHLALVRSGPVATLLASNRPLSVPDIAKIRSISAEMAFTPIAIPGETPEAPELRRIEAARTLQAMAGFKDDASLDYSPSFDSSPYFFNAVHIRDLPAFIAAGGRGGSLSAMLALFSFMLAAMALILCTIVVPWRRQARRGGSNVPVSTGGIAYFIAIGLGFMLVEMAMMQQLSLLLGHPIYSLVVVLAGLILSAGLGSLVSDRWPLEGGWRGRVPCLAAALGVTLYATAVLPTVHAFMAALLWQRVLVCLGLVLPCGFLLGFCFPVGMRWMSLMQQERTLPWMWALNGAASALGSFLAIVVSMETSITACALAGATCYALAGFALPSRRPAPERSTEQARMPHSIAKPVSGIP